MKIVNVFLSFFLFMIVCSCQPSHAEYQKQYAYLKKSCPKKVRMKETPYFLVILVDARHLDYSDNKSLFKTVVKHPSDGSKNGDFGHAWIYLKGCSDGKPVIVEGGHSGELGIRQAKYFDGIMNYIECGYANPTIRQKELQPRYEPNPVKYLRDSLCDGFFQKGSGKHFPTFAAKVDLTEEQFIAIMAFLKSYNFKEYSLTGNQCSSFVVQVAGIVGLELEDKITMNIDETLTLGEETLRLWSDPEYSTLTFSSPDRVEQSLMEAVQENRAQYALGWYEDGHQRSFSEKCSSACETMRRFPARFIRAVSF